SVPKALVAFGHVDRACNVGRRCGAWMEAQGVVLPYDLHVVAVGVDDLLGGSKYAFAEGALKFGEFYDSDEGFLAALLGVVIVDGHGPDGVVLGFGLLLVVATGVGLRLGVLRHQGGVHI